jgi:phosphoglucosamine mutase
MLEDAFCAGVASAGGSPVRAGVLPTPGVALLVRELRAQLGAVVSASHNPFPDNGIKLFGADGYKLDDDQEDRVAALLEQPFAAPTGAGVGETRPLPDGASRYADWVAAGFAAPCHDLRVLVDCANGAACTVAPTLLPRLGGHVDLVAVEPDGININVDCGSTHLAALSALVPAGGYDLGIAFDGDADRMLAVDHQGRPVDGDRILAILARDLLRRGALPGRRIAVTSMSNLGLHRALRELGIETVVTDVGDRYVLAAMREQHLVLGGEQSGHVIALERQTTGDGLVSAAMLLAALGRSGESLAEAASLVESFPQKLVNVRADRSRLAGSRAVWDVVDEENGRLGADGRIVLRASGTEPLVRVMVEHRDEQEVERLCASIAGVVERELGVP